MATSESSHTIRRATLVPDTLRPAGEGLHGAHRCTMMLDGELVRAYAKPLPWPKVVVECFAALLLRHWQLNVPEPLLVEIDGRDWFASVDAAYPSLVRRLLVNESDDESERQRRTLDAVAVALAIPDTPRALACDEAIANVDRNLGNILWDGANAAWVDHELSFNPGLAQKNKLAAMATLSGDHDAVERQAINIALDLDAAGVQAIVDAVEHSAGCATLVRKRIENLPARIIARFPVPSGDLFGKPH